MRQMSSSLFLQSRPAQAIRRVPHVGDQIVDGAPERTHERQHIEPGKEQEDPHSHGDALTDRGERRENRGHGVRPHARGIDLRAAKSGSGFPLLRIRVRRHIRRLPGPRSRHGALAIARDLRARSGKRSVTGLGSLARDSSEQNEGTYGGQ